MHTRISHLGTRLVCLSFWSLWAHLFFLNDFSLFLRPSTFVKGLENARNKKMSGEAAHTFNPSPQGAEADGAP